MKFKKSSAGLLGIILGLFVGCLQAAVTMPMPASTAHPVNRIVAVVNNHIILSSELDRSISQAIAHAKAVHLQLPDRSTLRTLLLNQLIARALQLQIAKNNEIKATDKKIDMALANMAKQQGLSVVQLFTKMKKQGYTRASFRQEVAKEITLNQMQMQVVGNSIKVSNAEIKQLKNQIMLRQKSTLEYNMLDLLVPLPDHPTSEQIKSSQSIAENISQALQSGSKQTQFKGAQVVSSGWQNVSSIPQIFVNQLQAMKIHQSSHPIQLGNGFHVLKLLGMRGKAARVPSDQQIKQIVYQQKFLKAVKKWVESLRKQAYIKIM